MAEEGDKAKGSFYIWACFTWNGDKICISAEIAAINWVNKETGQKLIDIHFERIIRPDLSIFHFCRAEFRTCVDAGRKGEEGGG